jgi:cell division septum initiation protein DivIVA
LNQLSGKLDQFIASYEQLKQQNLGLHQENEQLKEEMQKLRREYDALRTTESDRSEALRTKLTSILSRLDQLENLA